MPNILLISTIYPIPEKGNQGTPVCHYFTREWLKMGCNVRVVHFQSVYPAPFYWMARLNRERIAAKTGAVVYTRRDKGGRYEMEGVPIYRIPLFKPVPHSGYSRRAITKATGEILRWLNEDFFTPDIIVGHFPNPQIEVVGYFKDIWPQAKTAIVMHGDIELTKKVYGTQLIDLCKKIDLWGFRSESVHRQFEKEIMPVEHGFICYSGIPEDYVIDVNHHEFIGGLRRFVYVGEMIERKYPLKVMEALKKAYPDGSYQLSYVGNGNLQKEIHYRVKQDGLFGKVKLLGNIPRNSIKVEYDKADCMVMISRDEAYGLVYLEAMARGCITIASRDEGFDGVIKDGVNGFLCNAGDADELAAIICRINTLSTEKRRLISDNAIATAKSLTDYKAANIYLNNLLNK